MAVVLLVGGLAACGGDDGEDSDGGDDETTTSESSDAGETESGSGGNEAIAEFCEAVQEYVDKAAELQADPTNGDLQAELTDLGVDLGTRGGELAGEVPSFSAAENEEFQDCQTDFTTASLGG